MNDLELETHSYRGEEWCPCPLPFGNHPNGDRNASFSINLEDPDKLGLYNCFVCGGGNIIQLVHHLKDMSYEDAEDFVAGYLIGTDENLTADLMQILDSKEKKRDNVTPMPSFSDDTLFKYHFIHPWMRNEGFTVEAIKHFQIGYDAECQGIVFPHWWNGKLVGWQLRDLTGESENKYQNTPHFPKRNTIFHYDCDCVRQNDSVIVVESPKSVVKMWGLGVKNVVSTFGASMNPEQMAPLWNFSSVYLWFDNDPAGTKAYNTATKYLRNMVDLYYVPVVNIKKGDPGDLNTYEELMDYLNRAERVL